VIFSILLTCWFVLRDTTRGKIIGAAIVLALLVTAALAPAIFWNRMSTLSGNDASNQVEASAAASTDQRRDVLSRSIDYTFQHPVFGLGLGNFGVATAGDYGGSDAWVASHNTYTEISSEAGIPALVLFLALLITSVVSMRRASRDSTDDPKDFEVSLMARATLVSTLSLIFGIMFANITYEYFLYVCPIAIGVAVHRISSERRNAAAEVPAARIIPNQQSAVEMQAW
jgi:O-antigen ligase